MDDQEYYAMMRRQYSHTAGIKIKSASTKKPEIKKTEQATSAEPASQTPGTFSELAKKYGHEDAEMFYERNKESNEDE
ncbi:MAG: hypothetical protein MJ182_09580 [Treponema sp.]|nr:hypothetical protein [Treponema sp.]